MEGLSNSDVALLSQNDGMFGGGAGFFLDFCIAYSRWWRIW